MIKIFTPLIELKGVGPKFIQRFSRLNIKTVRDLLWHFPARYEDFSQISKIVDLKINESATIQGVIQDIKLRRTWRRRMFIVEALINDDSGSIKAIWFNQRFLLSILKKGRLVNLAGKVIESKQGICMSHPIYELVGANDDGEENEFKHTGRLVPTYPETRGLTSKAIRFLIKPILDDLEELVDPIPNYILEKQNLPGINDALKQIHFPEDKEKAKMAKRRFAFEDLFLLQLLNSSQRLKLTRQKSFGFKIDIEYLKSLLKDLPFELTHSQKKSLWEILQDLEKSKPMNRLLQGDVGSGKTIVVALAALVAASEDKQIAFMAPTEVLARQHYETFKKFFSGFDKGIGLITSAGAKVFYGDRLETEIKKNEFISKVGKGELKIVIGTHSLIEKDIKFKDLCFIIVDEQHRFGVKQRAELIGRRENNLIPHFLSMSATPIPRTLSLTLFSDLDLSIIDELPKNRKEIITKIVDPENRDKAYDFIREQVKKGRQAFVICPRIEAEDLNGKSEEEIKALNYQKLLQLEIKNVKEEYEKLSQKIFPDLKIGMLHGKIKSKEKIEIMKLFKEGKTDILVSTSVIEVGVDIPNASIMMIEGGEMFGLAQLYQFRGRVGRGEHQSFCFLFTDSNSKTTHNRLRSLLEAKNGFELAEKDLAIRGPGEILGEAQTGMPDLAMKAIKNPDLVKASRDYASKLLERDSNLNNYPLLKKYLEKFEKNTHLE